MTQLYINGKLAIIKDDTSFKISFENQFFTKASTYSFDVELPLTVSQNIDIFGRLNRKDLPHSTVEFECVLLSGNKILLSGSGEITQVTEQSVKIQLTGESLKFSYGNKGEELYIDELDLGDWYSRTNSYPGMQEKYTGSSYVMVSTMPALINANHEEWVASIFGNGRWVAYPIYNTNAETVCNDYVFRDVGNSTPRLDLPYKTSNSGERNGCPQIKFAVQPFVWYMCEIIAEATGYKLPIADNAIAQNVFFNRIFIANANIHIECQKCLPHWTVNEWWEQIEKTFGVMVVLSDTDKTMKLISRSKYFDDQSNIIDIDNVLDEFTITIEDASTEEISTQNVGYADSDVYKPYERITDEVKNVSEIKNFDSLDELRNWTKNNIEKAVRCILKAEGRTYIRKTIGLHLQEVDFFGDRIVNENKAIDVELKFIPCGYTEHTVNVVSSLTDEVGYIDNTIMTVETKILSRPDRADCSWIESEDELDIKVVDLESMLYGSGETPQKEETQDVAYIAIHAPEFDKISSQDLEWPRAWLYESTELKHSSYGSGSVEDVITPQNPDWNVPVYTDQGYSLSLNLIEGLRNIASETINTGNKINTAIKHCFKFIANEVPDTSALFIINNKKYLCEKIEVSFNNKSIDKLMTGYFFEVES